MSIGRSSVGQQSSAKTVLQAISTMQNFWIVSSLLLMTLLGLVKMEVVKFSNCKEEGTNITYNIQFDKTDYVKDHVAYQSLSTATLKFELSSCPIRSEVHYSRGSC